MKIGFVGLGNVGGKLAGSLLRNNVDLYVRDLNADLVEKFTDIGAKTCINNRVLMETCDAVITCLPSPAASASVMEDKDGLLEGMSSGKIWMEMSTTDQNEVKRLGKLIYEKSGSAVDCPVSGGCHRADTGNIAIFAGCEREIFDAILPLLKKMGRRIHYHADVNQLKVHPEHTKHLLIQSLFG